ncbi:2-dehydropantoate 2-reductase [Marinivivus vitaminiproducens]|uniref:2-dehydropantoate 2-reductase n=1 Tax=Marinivivus vitaminiproducens TaxID=3035935 RepID=UPI0027AB7468|nr:2-dehydropantoate 2-reductase [Geminicoccaceae bacterium SCSIO 64248]
MEGSQLSRVAVIGGGAIGGYLAAQAASAGHEVTLCVRNPFDRLVVKRDGAPREIPAAVVTEPDRLTAPFPWVFLTTKAQDTDGAAPWLERLAGPNTVVVVAQNGVAHEARVAPLAPGAAVLPALIYVAAERTAPGRVTHHVGDRIVVPDHPAGHRFRRLLEGSNAAIEADPDFVSAAWRKLFSNLVANPITALTLRRIGVMQEPDVIELGRAILTEAVAVARAEGANVAESDVQATLDLYPTYNPQGGSSMLYDRLAGRPLEHAYITGAVVDAATRKGIDVPVNRAILTLLRALDAGMRNAVQDG